MNVRKSELSVPSTLAMTFSRIRDFGNTVLTGKCLEMTTGLSRSKLGSGFSGSYSMVYISGETVGIEGKNSMEFIPISIGPEVASSSSRKGFRASELEEFRGAANSVAGEHEGSVDEANDTFGR